MHRKTLGRLRTFDVSNSDRFVLLEEVVASPSTVGASSFLPPEVLPFQSLPRGISSVFYLWNQPRSSLKKMLNKMMITLLNAHLSLLESSPSIP